MRYSGLYVSVSQIKTYLRCPRMFELRYVRGERAAFVPVALAFGRAFHGALAFYYAQIKDRSVAPPFDETLSVFNTIWETIQSDSIPIQVDDAVVDLKKARSMLDAFYRSVPSARPVRVAHVEQDFSVALYDPDNGEVLEERLVGAVDLVLTENGKHVVVEHKTAARRWSRDQIQFDLQATAYRYAARLMGLGRVELRLQVITKAKLPVVQVEGLERTREHEEDFMRTVLGVLRAIDAGVFYALRGSQCRSCQYAHACVGSGL